TLPMPCFVRVTNLDNGRSIVLRVNDRGPYARGRIIDVSRRGAQLLGYEGIGTAKVRVQIMAAESRQLAEAMKNGATVMMATAQTQPGEPPPLAAPRAAVAAAPLAPPPSQPAPSQPAPQAAPAESAAAPAPAPVTSQPLAPPPQVAMAPIPVPDP